MEVRHLSLSCPRLRSTDWLAQIVLLCGCCHPVHVSIRGVSIRGRRCCCGARSTPDGKRKFDSKRERSRPQMEPLRCVRRLIVPHRHMAYIHMAVRGSEQHEPRIACPPHARGVSWVHSFIDTSVGFASSQSSLTPRMGSVSLRACEPVSGVARHLTVAVFWQWLHVRNFSRLWSCSIGVGEALSALRKWSTTCMLVFGHSGAFRLTPGSSAPRVTCGVNDTPFLSTVPITARTAAFPITATAHNASTVGIPHSRIPHLALMPLI